MAALIRTALMAAFLVACVAPTQATCAESAASTLTTVADFVRPPEFTDVQLAPDGKHIAALVPKPDTPYENMLAIIDTATAKPVASVRSGSRTMIGHYQWANEHRLVMALALRIDSLEKPFEHRHALLAEGADPHRGLVQGIVGIDPPAISGCIQSG